MVSLLVQRAYVKRFLSQRERIAEVSIFTLFALLLAFFIFHHAMYLDEAQAWQIARHSQSIFDLASHLRYEGHPILWYLILYWPAHISTNMAWMQVINYCFALVTAVLIISERRVPLLIRFLIVFSASIFFYMGVTSRSYMLAGTLLIGAARCFQSKSDRHWMGILLIALAINTHCLAVPIALAMFWQLCCLQSKGDVRKRFREARFWKSSMVILAALGICFLTVRPAPDLWTPQYDQFGFNPLRFLVIGLGSIWHFFVYLPAGLLASSTLGVLTRPSIADSMLTLFLFLLAILALPSRTGRRFMITASFLWTLSVWATVHRPSPFHASLLFLAYLIAVMSSDLNCPERPLLSGQVTRTLLIVLFVCQVAVCVSLMARERTTPFSASKAVAEWLEKSGLSHHPLVFTPDSDAPSVLGYTGIDSAYLPTCRCRGSFVIFRKGRDPYRQVNSEELINLQREFGSSPVLISFFQLEPAELQSLGLTLLYTPPAGNAKGENVFVYGMIEKMPAEVPVIRQ